MNNDLQPQEGITIFNDLSAELTARQKLDILIERLPHAQYEEGTEYIKMHLPHIDSIQEIGQGFTLVKEQLQKTLGPEHRVSFDGLFEIPALNIPVQPLRDLNEEQSQKVLEALAIAVRHELSLRKEKTELQEVIGPLFKSTRLVYHKKDSNNQPTDYIIDQKIAYRKGEKGFKDYENPKDRRKAYYPLKHLGKCLNAALGEKLFEAIWHDGQFPRVFIKEKDVPTLLAHPKLDDVKAIFADPMRVCEKYHASTARGMFGSGLRKLSGKENTAALPAYHADKTLPPQKDGAVEEPWHPADDRRAGKSFTDNLGQSLGGNEHGTYSSIGG